MHKDELIYFHELLVVVGEYCATETTAELNTSDYTSLGVGPREVYREKKAHREAVQVLSALIASSLQKAGPPKQQCEQPASHD